ncbi:hypothetical protein ACFXOY_11340 [Streptomyces niveus]|uniref:hypothetical protein n=1 Tax=Streptomyces niveus TaxID=193462 RepID=UPI00368A8D51
MRSTAWFRPVERVRLDRVVRLLVVLAHAACCTGVLTVCLLGCPFAGLFACPRGGVLEAAQLLVGEPRASTSVRDFFRSRTAARSTVSPCPTSGSWSPRSGAAAGSASSCSGIAACWCAVTSYARPRRAVVVRSFSRTTALARTARS